MAAFHGIPGKRSFLNLDGELFAGSIVKDSSGRPIGIVQSARVVNRPSGATEVVADVRLDDGTPVQLTGHADFDVSGRIYPIDWRPLAAEQFTPEAIEAAGRLAERITRRMEEEEARQMPGLAELNMPPMQYTLPAQPPPQLTTTDWRPLVEAENAEVRRLQREIATIAQNGPAQPRSASDTAGNPPQPDRPS